MTLAVVLALYATVLLGIGAWSARRGTTSAEDYFLAGRSFGTVVLFMALFGTNITAFALLGLPGLAYHKGVPVFGFFGATAAFWGPLVLILLGYPIWRFGRSGGYITPAQMFSERFASPAVGRLLVALLLLYTLPYVVIGIMGGGIALHRLSEGGVSFGQAAALLTGITVLYTSLGGMRGTAWTNVFQATVFMIFLVVACGAIAGALGGPRALHTRLLTERPDLLDDHGSGWRWASGLLVGPVSIIAFPHMFMRLLTARDAVSLKRTVQLYPIALTVLFVPVVLIGVWGAVVEPGLIGKASDDILPILVGKYLPPWLSAVGLAAILAAVMSSLDAQLLTISTMLSIDVFGRFSAGNRRRCGRVVVIAVAGLALAVALYRFDAIFRISVYAFSGYTLIVPVMIAAFFWRRSTAAGIIVGSVMAHGLLLLYSWPGDLALHCGLPVPPDGAFPVLGCLVIECVLIVLISLCTNPPPADITSKFAAPYSAPPRLERAH